jgi:hypothetical protein
MWLLTAITVERDARVAPARLRQQRVPVLNSSPALERDREKLCPLLTQDPLHST